MIEFHKDRLIPLLVALLCLNAMTALADPPRTPASEEPGSLSSPSSASSSIFLAGVTPELQAKAEKEVESMILKAFERWNAHDITGFMESFWKSPNLIIIDDGREIRGWSENLADFQRGYHDPGEMGILQLDSFQFQLITPDLGLSVTHWTVRLKQRTVSGVGSETIRKFPDGWKTVVDHDTVNSP